MQENYQQPKSYKILSGKREIYKLKEEKTSYKKSPSLYIESSKIKVKPGAQGHTKCKRSKPPDATQKNINQKGPADQQI